MDWLVTRLRTPTVVWASAVGTVLNMIALQIEPYAYAKGTSATIWDLQFAGTARRFSEVLETWIAVNGIEAIDNVAKTIVRLDYTFPVLYPLFFASALAYLWASPGSLRWGRWMVLLPLIAGLCDMTENTLHLVVLADLPPLEVASISNQMVAWATRFAVTKYGLLAISLALILAGIGRIAVASRRRPNSR